MKFRWFIIWIIFAITDNVNSTNRPDITLMSSVIKDNYLEFTCVAGANVLDNALTFITPIKREYENIKESKYVSSNVNVYNNSYDCQFGTYCTSWSNWTSMNGLPIIWASDGIHNLSIITDERWEKFQYFYKDKIQTHWYRFRKEVHNIGISVRTEGKIVLYLLDKSVLTPVIKIEFNNNVTHLYSCPFNNMVNCNFIKDGKGFNISANYWNHIQINVQGDRIQFFSENKELLSYTRKSTSSYRKYSYDIKTIVLKNSEEAIWKIHKYSYLSIPWSWGRIYPSRPSNPQLGAYETSLFSIYPAWQPLGPPLRADETGFLCVSLFAATCMTCSLHFRLGPGSPETEVYGIRNQDMQSWEPIKIEIQGVSNQKYQLQVRNQGSSAGYWLIDGIRHCYKGEKKIITMVANINNNETVSCQTLNYTNWWTSLKGGRIDKQELRVCNDTLFTGTRCDLPCQSILRHDCSNTMVCEPSEYRSLPRCACAAGYHGYKCQLKNIQIIWNEDKMNIIYHPTASYNMSSFILLVDLINTDLLNTVAFSYREVYMLGKYNEKYTINVPKSAPLSSKYWIRMQPQDEQNEMTLEVSSPPVTPRFVGELELGLRTNITQQIFIPPPNFDTVTRNSSLFLFVCNISSTEINFTFINEIHSILHNWTGCQGISWIPLEMQVTKRVLNFTLGDPSINSNNEQLTEEYSYIISVIIINKYEGQMKHVISSVTVYSVTNRSAVVIAVLLIILFILSFGLGVLWWIYKYSKIRSKYLGYHAISVVPWPITKDVNISKYEIKFDVNELITEYSSIPNVTNTQECGGKQENLHKNRYKNIIAYDHSRVKLRPKGNNTSSDYINANYIHISKRNKYKYVYIATQDPKTNTFYDFWQMIWQEEVQLIVMLTNHDIDKQSKMEQYWPNKTQTREFMNILVETVQEEIYADFTHRIFKITYNQITREIQHLQYTSWPEEGVPSSPQLLIPFLQEVRDLDADEKPLVVHCRDGISRTGTIILIDICIKMASRKQKIYPAKYLSVMRNQRMDMITNPIQYILANAVIVAYTSAPASIISCNCEFSKIIRHEINSKRIEKEIQYLQTTSWHHEIVPQKVEPYNTPTYASGGEYLRFVNVRFVDSYKIKQKYIVTPAPEFQAYPTFWLLVSEYNVQSIIVLEKNIKKMWPTKKEIKVFRMLQISSSLDTESIDCSICQIRIKHKISGEIQKVLLMQIKEPEQLATSSSRLAWLADEITRAERPVVIIGAGGPLITAAHVLERMRARRFCDVLDTLRSVRACGLSFLPDNKQLAALYSAADVAWNRGLDDGYVPPKFHVNSL